MNMVKPIFHSKIQLLPPSHSIQIYLFGFYHTVFNTPEIPKVNKDIESGIKSMINFHLETL